MINFDFAVKHLENLFSNRPGSTPKQKTPKHPLHPSPSAPLRFRRNRRSAEELRIIDIKKNASTTKRHKDPYEAMHCDGRLTNRDSSLRGEATPHAPSATAGPHQQNTRFTYGMTRKMAVATSVAAVLSSARHAGENSTQESPKAQPPEPLRQKDRVCSTSLESDTNAQRLRIHRRGTRSATRHIYVYGAMTGNLSGTRDRWGEPGDAPRSPFFVYFNGAPPR